MGYTEMQKIIITTDKPKVIVLSAAASGKTRTLVGRLKYLLDKGVDPSEIVAITFTNNAASVMYERLGYPEGIFIGTVHSYCNYLLRGGSIDTSEILEQKQFDDLFEEIKQNPNCIKHVTHLLVDEAQDSTTQQFEFFELINPDNYMYIGDYRQSIYSFNGANPDYIINLSKEPDVVVYEMKQNFRNSSDILSFAKKFLYRLGPNYSDESISMRGRGQYHSVWEIDTSPSGAIEELKRANMALNTQWGDWFLLVRTNADIDLFKTLLTKEGIPCDTFKQAELTNSEIKNKIEDNTVKILTVHSAKGLENKCILSYNIRAYKDEEARLCYVSATRARDFLIWARMPKKKRKNKIVNWE